MMSCGRDAAWLLLQTDRYKRDIGVEVSSTEKVGLFTVMVHTILESIGIIRERGEGCTSGRAGPLMKANTSRINSLGMESTTILTAPATKAPGSKTSDTVRARLSKKTEKLS